MFRVTNIREISRSGIRTHRTAETSPTLWKISCNRNSENYILGAIFNYFFLRFSKSIENWTRPVKLSVKIQHRKTSQIRSNLSFHLTELKGEVRSTSTRFTASVPFLVR